MGIPNIIKAYLMIPVSVMIAIVIVIYSSTLITEWKCGECCPCGTTLRTLDEAWDDVWSCSRCCICKGPLTKACSQIGFDMNHTDCQIPRYYPGRDIIINYTLTRQQKEEILEWYE